MERKIYQRLKQWKEEGGRTALLIDGARRVGKTHIALEFAKREYKTFLFIDFNRAGSAVKTLFNEGLEDLDTFLPHCLLSTTSGFTGGKALSFSMRYSSFPAPARQSSTLSRTGALIIWKPVPSCPSRGTYRTLSFPLKKST